MKRALGVRIAGVVTALVLGLGLAALGVFLVREGLERSDQWASVLGHFLNLLVVPTAVFGAWVSWRGRRGTTPGSPRVVNQSIRAGRDAYVAENQTIVQHYGSADGYRS